MPIPKTVSVIMFYFSQSYINLSDNRMQIPRFEFFYTLCVLKLTSKVFKVEKDNLLNSGFADLNLSAG
jgi:hypothetical protein